MKNNILPFLLTTLMSMVGTKAFGHDFSNINADGVTIYYAWVQYEKDLAVTYCSDKTQKYSGTVIIPETANRGAWQYSVTSIGQEAFSHCRDLNSIVIPNSVKNIYSQAFYDCSHLESITIPNSVTNIGESAFGACGFTSVTIPNSVTNIGTGAFQWCIYLTSVTIPNSVKSMGEGIFYGCSGLTTIVSEIENPFAVADNLFYCDNINIYDTATLIVPVGKVSVYQSKAGWKKFKKIYEVVQIGEEFESDGLRFQKLTSNTVSLVSRDTYYSGDIVIPDQVTYKGCTYDVTSIAQNAFSDCSGLTSIIIPSSVTSIGREAFRGCSGLMSATIGVGVTSIGESAFSDCSDLTSIIIPSSVTSIGRETFKGCSGLTSITVEDGNMYYDSRNNYNAIIDRDNQLILGCKNTIIPNSVTSIGEYAFYGCSSLTSITIPSSVTRIGSYAFNGCSGLTSVDITDLEAWCKIQFDFINPLIYAHHLYMNGEEIKDLVIPNSVTSINADAFDGCSGLTSVTIPSSITSIGNRAFFGCSGLTKIVSEIEEPFTFNEYAFYCDNNQIYNTVTLLVPVGKLSAYQSNSNWNNFKHIYEVGQGGKIGQDFEIDGLRFLIGENNTVSVVSRETYYSDDIVIPCQVTFNGCNFVVTSIAPKAFYECYELNSVEIPNSVTSIGENAFSGCSGLNSITIPNSVTSIGENAFYDCYSLTSITIPNSVTSIGDKAFYDCYSLTSITIPSSVTSIGNSAFSGCSGLTSVTIDNSATTIGDYAFQNCSSLTDVSMGNSVTSIGNSTFSGCSGLTSVTIPSSVTSFGNDAFRNCEGLTSVHISDLESWCKIVFGNGNSNPLSCAHHLFLNGVEITDLSIPNSVTSIGSAFSGCSALTSITIPNSVTSIGSSAFSGCRGLTSITIPNNVTSIESFTFNGCSGLTSVVIGENVRRIGICSFDNCPRLTDIYCLPEGAPDATLAFGNTNTITAVENKTLHVLAASLASYKALSPWEYFKITTLKCFNPTITYDNGKVSFSCEIEGVDFHYSIRNIYSYSDVGSSVNYSPSVNISVYATKEGYDNSDTVTKVVKIPLVLKGDLTGDGVVNVADHVKLTEIIKDQNKQ